MKRGPAGIQYAGIAGASAPCVAAVVRLLQCGVRVALARVLTHDSHHCLLLMDDGGDLVAVKSGFGSGYSGTGAHAFSYVLALLYAHGAQLEEYAIDEGMLNRVDMAALSRADIKRISKAKPIRPNRWPKYVFKEDFEKGETGMLWRQFDPVVPFAIVDPRIMDLALQLHEKTDDCLLQGYRRLEDNVRERSGLEEHGVKLFSQVFLSEPPQLTWNDVDKGEHKGRASLFIAVFMAYRNPRAHREPRQYSSDLAEFLMLNHLFLLEDEAVNRKGKRRPVKNKWEVLREEALLVDSNSKWRRRRKRS